LHSFLLFKDLFEIQTSSFSKAIMFFIKSFKALFGREKEEEEQGEEQEKHSRLRVPSKPDFSGLKNIRGLKNN
jgi:hypothetical protein